MSSFLRVALVVGLVLVLSGFALGQARLGPYVVDSNGEKVGHVFDQTRALIFIGGELTIVNTGRSGFAPMAFTVFFADDGCGGTPLMEADSTDFLYGQGWYTSDGAIHYYATGSTVGITTHSLQTVNADGTLGSCNVSPNPNIYAPELTAQSAFTPPFSVADVLPVSAAPATATFLDVPTDNPYFQFVEALVASGITAGCGGGNYCPNNTVTRGQMAVFLAKALGLN